MDYSKTMFIGKVKGLQISSPDGKKQAFFHLVVNKKRPDANGQWVDKPVDVPMFASDKKADLIEQYVVEGQELWIECQYEAWTAEGQNHHVFTVLSVGFGFKPKGTGGGPSTAPTGRPPMG
ncbi:hypothetical protein LCGC14_0682400 [marine sediment metagenome]|uniref:Single-stranded DNA-binding protein n=1 Tax=marine sediment metagenome TaxID=412755 RepID=A0A0F9T969_9ZZZZ